MKRHWLLAIIAANLLVLAALVFIYPQFMVAPGALDAGHTALTTDCFACHSPLRGASAERCIGCHALVDIGVRTTKGVVLGKRTVKTSFHQVLRETDCMGCHTDHAGPKLTHAARKPFSHAMFRIETASKCDSCHSAPSNKIHRDLTVPCSQCHTTEHWKPASFKHALLDPAALSRCESCHKTPGDALHQQIASNCQQCHSTKAWKPASFDHAKYFVLDSDHNVSCTTCHSAGNYKTYTCYGCHEHTVENVRRKHEKEGVRDFQNCAKCHRSAHGKPDGRGERGGGERD